MNIKIVVEIFLEYELFIKLFVYRVIFFYFIVLILYYWSILVIVLV